MLNAVAVGSYVRCGAALPALALLGTRSARGAPWHERWPGRRSRSVSTVAQGLSDPQLKTGFLPGGSVLILALWGVGPPRALP